MREACVAKSKICVSILQSKQRNIYTPNHRQVHMSISVCVIGVGGVGEAIAHTFVAQELCSVLFLKDANFEKAQGVAMDFNHANALTHCKVTAVSDWKYVPREIDFVFITAGVRQKPGESRRDLCDRNAEIMKAIVPGISEHSPYAKIIVVSNPCDVMTRIAQTLAGPANIVFGSGTFLDTCRLRSLIASKFNIRAQDVHNAFVLGEHGDSSVLYTRYATVSHIPLAKMMEEDELRDFHTQVIDSAEQVIQRKGYTSTAISFACAEILRAMLHREHTIMPLSVNVKSHINGVSEDVCLSVLCTINREGVFVFEKHGMRKQESRQLAKTAEQLIALQRRDVRR